MMTMKKKMTKPFTAMANSGRTQGGATGATTYKPGEEGPIQQVCGVVKLELGVRKKVAMHIMFIPNQKFVRRMNTATCNRVKPNIHTFMIYSGY